MAAAVSHQNQINLPKQDHHNGSFLPSVPESPSVTGVTNLILNQKTELHQLQGSGAEGQSGCSIYFARDTRPPKQTLAVAKVFPLACRSDFLEEHASYQKLFSLHNPPVAARVLGVGKCRDETTGQWSDVIVYQLAPGQALNTIIRDIGRVTTLQRIAKLTLHDGRSGVCLESLVFKELGVHLPDCTPCAGGTYTESVCDVLERRFDQLMTELTSSVQAVASTLAKLHKVHGEWGEAGESVVAGIRSKLQSWIREIQGPSRDQYVRAIGSDGVEQLDALVDRAIEESRNEGLASLLHGDASSGNFFWHPISGITMIDYGGLARSMDADGQPIGPAEMDVAGFYERLRKYSGQFGMRESDIALVQAAFWKAYKAQGVPLDEGIIQLFRARTQLSRVWSAVAKLEKEDDEHRQVQLRAKVDFEWNYLQKIFPEAPRPWRVLFVASTSGPGKGGLPVLNQELVQAMQGLRNTSVTLFVVKSDEEKNDLSSSHGRAKVISIPPGQCNPSALLYHAAKVHQPGDVGLPAANQKDGSAFDLVIGHSRYSSAAAALIRERWYPAAKLVLITHTSALRKSDAAWKWYGQTRELAYVEAARLAMLDEKILPNADLAVGIGPVLTAEAREREWMGQCSRQRWAQTGPRFHELVPGVHISDHVQPQRQPDGIFRVLLPGRADDPAKGLDDAVYAVQKIATLGHKVSLHVLGVPVEDVNSWQHHVDNLTGIPGLVHIHPFSNDRSTVLQHYHTTDLIIMPSTHEGFGMIFTEVAGLGVPILVTQDSGAGQLALDRTRFPTDVGQACVVMDESAYGIVPSLASKRVAIWAHRIDEVRRYPNQARQRARALRQIMRDYSWTHAAKALLCAAMESETDSIQVSNGAIAPVGQPSIPHIPPDVVAAMQRASQTRNRSGMPSPKLAEEVLHSLPKVGSTFAALEKHVSAAVGCPVHLQNMDSTHPQGFSGAVIFFAYTEECSTTKEAFSIMPTETAHGRVVAVVKLFIHGLDNGITEELSSLEWLFLQAKGDIETAAPLAVGQMTWENNLAGVVTYRIAQGVSLYQLMMQLGPMPPGPTRADLLTVLKAGTREVARTLARLHAFGVEDKSSADYLEWYLNALAQRVEQALQHRDVLCREGLEIDYLARDVKQVIADCQRDKKRNPRTAVVHGDAHPGNFFYDQATGQVTMIDTTTLHCSLDERGEPAGALERDLGHFVHMLRRTGEQYGMSAPEILDCAMVFINSYLAFGDTAVSIQTVRLLMVCSALSFLNSSARSHGGDLGQQTKIVRDLLCFGAK